MSKTFLTAGAALLLMAGITLANDFPSQCNTQMKKVCAKWAQGAPGTPAGKCIEWKWLKPQCASPNR
ncbi:hypothetical protein [Bradyrhizobium sp. 170]|uniref:hypothetical protein n=1 Tax=Bradyrhizobium sp. 170 TaxID=2782641 RepID=UPI001FFE3B39|nr:hypothetical protein [Bradyrhizobium sp. 170]UPK07029.1 hypothetical protein IVB05_16740 [Bradyrhizobium sp. 170]